MILGIDPGYATLGYAFITGLDTPKVVDVGVISTSKDKDYFARLLEIGENLDNLIQAHKPRLAAIEKLFFKTNQKTAIEVAQARGAILFVMKKNHLPISEYSPLQIKKSIALKGTANKKEVQWMLKKILNLKTIIKQDDAADALAIALTHWYCHH